MGLVAPRPPKYGARGVLMVALIAILVAVVAVADPPPARLNVTSARASRQCMWAGLDGVHVLVAEDHEVVRAAVTEVIRRSGGRCDAVADGIAAVESALSRKYDILLVDLAMPRLVGCEVAREIRRHEAKDGGVARIGAALPIVALTGCAAEEVARQCVGVGISLCLTKPVTPQELLEAVRLLISLGAPRFDGINADSRLPARATGGRAGEMSIPFNMDELRQKWAADDAFCHKLLKDFCRRVGDDLACIETAIAAGRFETVQDFAHSLKGAALYVTARRIGALAERLEALGAGADPKRVAALVTALRYELRVFDDRLVILLRGDEAGAES